MNLLRRCGQNGVRDGSFQRRSENFMRFCSPCMLRNRFCRCNRWIFWTYIYFSRQNVHHRPHNTALIFYSFVVFVRVAAGGRMLRVIVCMVSDPRRRTASQFTDQRRLQRLTYVRTWRTCRHAADQPRTMHCYRLASCVGLPQSVDRQTDRHSASSIQSHTSLGPHSPTSICSSASFLYSMLYTCTTNSQHIEASGVCAV